MNGNYNLLNVLLAGDDSTNKLSDSAGRWEWYNYIDNRTYEYFLEIYVIFMLEKIDQ